MPDYSGISKSAIEQGIQQGGQRRLAQTEADHKLREYLQKSALDKQAKLEEIAATQGRRVTQREESMKDIYSAANIDPNQPNARQNLQNYLMKNRLDIAQNTEGGLELKHAPADMSGFKAAAQDRASAKDKSAAYGKLDNQYKKDLKPFADQLHNHETIMQYLDDPNSVADKATAALVAKALVAPSGGGGSQRVPYELIKAMGGDGTMEGTVQEVINKISGTSGSKMTQQQRNALRQEILTRGHETASQLQDGIGTLKDTGRDTYGSLIDPDDVESHIDKLSTKDLDMVTKHNDRYDRFLKEGGHITGQNAPQAPQFQQGNLGVGGRLKSFLGGGQQQAASQYPSAGQAQPAPQQAPQHAPSQGIASQVMPQQSMGAPRPAPVPVPGPFAGKNPSQAATRPAAHANTEVDAGVPQTSPAMPSTPGPIKAGNVPGQPQPGSVEDGHRFKGGDPSKQENWEAVM
jgi:hypothetical protein